MPTSQLNMIPAPTAAFNVPKKNVQRAEGQENEKEALMPASLVQRTEKQVVVNDPTKEREEFLNEVVDALAATGQVFARDKDIFTNCGDTLQLSKANTIGHLAAGW